MDMRQAWSLVTCVRESEDMMGTMESFTVLVLSCCLGALVGDHHHGHQPNYVYPDNSYQYSNTSLYYGSQRSRFEQWKLFPLFNFFIVGECLMMLPSPPVPPLALMRPFPSQTWTLEYTSTFPSPSAFPLRGLWWQEDHSLEVWVRRTVPGLCCTRVLRSTWVTWPELMATLACWGPCARPAPLLCMMKVWLETLSPSSSHPITPRKSQTRDSKNISQPRQRVK